MEEYSKKELIEIIKKMQEKQKFGLLWEEREEQNINENCTPYLQELSEFNRIRENEVKNNYLIEGENYYALKILQKTHKNKIDIIYIDPPYNTGNEFTYNDKLVENTDKFKHNKWLSFMNKRLNLAKELLNDDGVIFISIDDNELYVLKLLMDKIFGEQNFVSNMIWRKGGGKSDSKYLANRKEYILIYRKTNGKGFTQKETTTKAYTLEDEKGIYQLSSFMRKGLRYSSNLDYEIILPNGEKIYAGNSKSAYEERKKGNHNFRDWCWTITKEEYERRLKEGLITYKKQKDGWKVYTKIYREGKTTPYEDVYTGSTGIKSNMEMKDIFNGEVPFDYAKPIDLMKFLINLHTNKDGIILDFFSGSGTTGHAVMELNKEDGGNRSFILCTNNEVTNNSEREYLYHNGYIENKFKRTLTRFKKENPIEYKKITQSNEYEKNGIARSVTYERLKRVIEGYTTPKGIEIEGNIENLIYYKITLEKDTDTFEEIPYVKED